MRSTWGMGRGDSVNLEIASVASNSGRNGSSCWPVDAFTVKKNGMPRWYEGNMLANGDFEVGPAFLSNSSEGILLNDEPDRLISPLQQWSVLGTIRYIDSKHYKVPQGKAAVELLSGAPSGIQVDLKLPTTLTSYTLNFTMGDADDSCVGDFILYVQTGVDVHNFTMRSNGTGSASRHSVRFKAESSRETSIRLYSFNETRASDGVLCGPVLDNVVLDGSMRCDQLSGNKDDLHAHAGWSIIWDEVGEDQFEREKVMLELEQECLEVYRRKVDTANISRARLHQQLAESEAEFTHLLLSLGERSLPGRPEKMAGTLKEQLNSITPALREMQLRKEERVKQFRVLEEYQNELQRLHSEKSDRLQRVEKYMSRIKNLSATLGMDSSLIITKVHPSLNELSGLSKNISDGILEKLDSTVKSLELEKQTRLDKLQQLGRALANLWHLMDTPYEDCQQFLHVTSLSSMASAEISTPGSLTPDIVLQDENRYSVSRGAHKNLKRAERARVMVNKIPALVDLLISKTRNWEEERKKVFLYDEVPLLAMLEEYNMLRKEKEEEKQREREQKKAQSKVVTQHDSPFGTRPGTSSHRLFDKSSNGGFSNATPLNTRLSLGVQQMGSNSISSPTESISFVKGGRKPHGQRKYTQKGSLIILEKTQFQLSHHFLAPFHPRTFEC
ncbi:microtubule-associated protein 8 [Sesamum angolense]|uniref:Microtubule-associated protein 8 n=1 Tax=Sesamum angolense TaxID=2727404 RepID=A0AAE2BZ02_9LAMI|nr:microtubule-associated protein 8 [Sesamum angolense]